MRSRLWVCAGLVYAGVAGCSLPSALVVSAPQGTYACNCDYSFCSAPTAGCGCTGGGTVSGSVQTLLCESNPAAVSADCAAACSALQLGAGTGCGPASTGSATPSLVAAESCNAGGATEAAIGGGVANSFVVHVGAGSTLNVVDDATGSGATTNAHGTLAYTLDGKGGIVINLIALTFDDFTVDLTPVSSLAVIGQGQAAGTISGTAASFPPSSFTVTISGQSVPPRQPNTVLQVAEPANDGEVTGTFDPVSNAFTLSGLFRSSDFVAGTNFVAALSLQGSYGAAPPTAVAGGPYDAPCGQGTVQLDGSRSTDGNGSPDDLVYQWFEGQNLLAVGSTPTVTLAPGTHDLTLRVFDPAGQFAEASTTVTIAGGGPPVITGVTNSFACLAPSNGLFVRYDLGQQIQVQVQDACDPNPVVSVVSVQDADGDADQTADDGDVHLGRSAFCIRSQSDGPSPRVYTVTLQATDSQGLSSAVATTQIEVVPNGEGDGDGDGRGGGDGHPGCDAGTALCADLPASDFITPGDSRCDFADAGSPTADAGTSSGDDDSPGGRHPAAWGTGHTPLHFGDRSASGSSPGGAPPDGGGGCSTASGAGFAAWLALGLLLRRRRW